MYSYNYVEFFYYYFFLNFLIYHAHQADIKPRTDGNNGKVRYDILQDTIDSIFATYPAVEKKYNEYVPAHISKSDFWTRFFQSHYYSAHTTVRTESLFHDCAKYDDKG